MNVLHILEFQFGQVTMQRAITQVQYRHGALEIAKRWWQGTRYGHVRDHYVDQTRHGAEVLWQSTRCYPIEHEKLLQVSERRQHRRQCA